MLIDCQFDDAVLQNRLATAKDLAVVTQGAINDTVKEIQKAERVGIDRAGLHLRKTQFIYNLIKIFKFAKATKGVAYAEIGIDNTKPGVLLSLFEKGGEKDPRAGASSIAIPLTGEAARPAISQFITTGLGYKALKFTHVGGRILGLRGTYLIPGVGIFQHNKGQSGSDLIYVFKKQVKIPKKLHFVDIATEVFGEVFHQRFTERFEKMLERKE